MSGPDVESSETATRRKRVVGLLDEMEASVTVDQLVDELERATPRGPGRPAHSASWERCHERLHEEDLPALDRAGLLRFDDERGLVTGRGDSRPPRAEGVPTGVGGASGRADDLAPTDRFARCFLGFGVVSLALLAVTTLDVGPFARAPDGLVSTGLVLVFGLLSLVNAALQ